MDLSVVVKDNKKIDDQELKTLKKQLMDLQNKTSRWYGDFCAETNGFLVEIDRLIRRNSS